jgi:hypothetical protein
MIPRTVPSAVRGPGLLPLASGAASIAGLSEHVSAIIGSSGRAAFIRAKTVTILPGSTDSVPLVIDMTDSTFTSDIFRVVAGDENAALLINNNGVLFVYRGLSVLDNDDTQPKVHIEQTTAGITFGDGTNPVDWAITRTAADTASLGTGDRLLGVLGSDIKGGFATAVKWGNT